MNFNKQYQAGYISDGIMEFLFNSIDDIDWKSVLRHLSSFDVETNSVLNEEFTHPLLSVLNNIICRGLPTKASILVEEYLMQKCNLTVKHIDALGQITFKLNNPSETQKDLMKRSFIIIDPRLDRTNKLKFELNSWENLGSKLEEIFFCKIIPDLTSDFIIQLMETQRSLESIIKFTGQKKRKLDTWLGNSVKDFYSQRADFTIELPISGNSARYPGLIIEIDGPQHNEAPQKNLDNKRDKTINRINWFPTARIKTNELNQLSQESITKISEFLNNPYITLLKQNYNEPIYTLNDGLNIMEYCLIPYGVARIQKLIIELIRSNILKINQQKWCLAFIERDIPCANIAIMDFINWINTLNKISNYKISIPEIEVKIINTFDIVTDNIKADILIDIAILQRPGFTFPDLNILNKLFNPPWFIIRSSFSPVSERKLHIDRPLTYHNFVTYENESAIYDNILTQNLRTILQNIFRKNSFRLGQLEIINRALQRKDVIGLLPTGAGKSITYQFASLLQPGITIVVDPIKSLMKDQNDNLLKIGIDSTIFINSSIKTPEERRIATMKVVRGEILFTFISPERFQIEEFRRYLQIIHRSKINFSYCVVDETHCVSEWGHDFRTAYLRLGDNARNFCKNKYEKVIPIIGLTGTASYDVLSDVQRELAIHDEESIVKLESSDREELVYDVKEVIPSFNQTKLVYLTDKTRINLVPDAKKNTLLEILNSLPSSFNTTSDVFYKLDGESTKAGLIFSPYKGDKSGYGVVNILNYIMENFKILESQSDFYTGGSDVDDEDLKNFEEVHDNFTQNKINLLVSTKAFGMGVDKPNIRYTIHMNMPPSIESFYQEAGRAGRDQNTAYCYILHTRKILNTNNEYITNDSDKGINKSFLKNSFKGIEKELSVLFEILKDIKYPSKPNTSQLEFKIYEKIGLFFYLNLWEKYGSRLYINKDDKTYGYINLNTLSIITEKDELKKAANDIECRTVIEQVLEVAKNETPHGNQLISWLRGSFKPPDTVGILKILDKLKIGESYVTNISFENDKFDALTDYLKSINDRFSLDIIKGSYSYSERIDTYIKNLKSKFYATTNQGINIPNTVVVNIEKYFSDFRDESDTFKAIYRLSLLGIIKDYTVDYNLENIKIVVQKLENEKYVDNLYKYFSRYVSKEEAAKKIVSINTEDTEQVIYDCVEQLVKFVYDNIRIKRSNAIELMNEACSICIDEKANNFKEFINNYLDSKYSKKLREFATNYDINAIWNFINDTKGYSENVKHLRGGCDNLLVSYPGNPIFLLLRSFSKIMLPNPDITGFSADFRAGWDHYLELIETGRHDYIKYINKYLKLIKEYNEELEEIIATEILHLHTKWLKNYNKTLIPTI